MALFTVPTRPGREQDIQLAKKANSKAKQSRTVVRGGNTLLEKISTIKAMVDTNLGQYKEESIIIQDEQVLHDYLSKCIENNVISIDTETTGLDPLQDTLVGICIYTPDQKTAYIPVNHKSYITGQKVEGQLSVEVLHNEFQRIVEANIDVIMFNAAFDIRFMRSGIDVRLVCTWDCYVASRLMNENEPNKGLKKLHQKYVLNGQGDAFKFDDLFRGITFDNIPITTGYLYAAHDAIITYELYLFQKPYLTQNTDECERCELHEVAWVFHNIEMPCIQVVVDMEDNGIEFDSNYANELSIKYNELLVQSKQKVYDEIDKYRDRIASCRIQYKLEDPINIDSPKQLQALLYDIIGLDAGVDKRTKKPIRGTGEPILSTIDHPICKAILDYRGINKLITTYIDKLPNCVNPTDGRIHCKFNQYGADTGRFSSQDPNLQNIPSHNKDIRKMFKAQDGYVLMSSDFSQQEPKCLAALCRKQGDSQMYETFMQGKDLYSEIASKAFNKPYEECLEFRPDGTTNKDGKARRTQAKSILLGVLYGRGVPSIAEQLGCSVDKAQQIKDSVFKGFPAIKKFETDSLEMAREIGYVTTVCGRKRRLPDLQLDEFEFSWKDGIAPDDDPLSFDDVVMESEIPERLIRKYTSQLHQCWGNQKREIMNKALEQDGLVIKDNGGKIADSERQCVNARIQGSAADLTKLAMIELRENSRLQELGFKILIPVHDEIIAECPEENAKECSELLAKTMSHAAEQILEMPIKCDVEITKQWYGERVSV